MKPSHIQETLLVLEREYEQARHLLRRSLVNFFPPGLAVTTLSSARAGKMVSGVVQEVDVDHGIRVALDEGGVQVCHWTSVHPRPVPC